MMIFWLKAMGISLITAGAFLNGAAYSAKYRQRVLELERSLAVTAEISGRLKAALPPPDELLRQMCRENRELPKYVYSANELMTKYNFSDAWKNAIFTCEQPFDDSDRLLLSKLGDILGKSDIETQLSQIELLSDRIKTQIGQARAQATEKSRLSQTLWTMAGAAAAIMLL